MGVVALFQVVRDKEIVVAKAFVIGGAVVDQVLVLVVDFDIAVIPAAVTFWNQDHEVVIITNSIPVINHADVPRRIGLVDDGVTAFVGEVFPAK